MSKLKLRGRRHISFIDSCPPAVLPSCGIACARHEIHFLYVADHAAGLWLPFLLRSASCWCRTGHVFPKMANGGQQACFHSNQPSKQKSTESLGNNRRLRLVQRRYTNNRAHPMNNKARSSFERQTTDLNQSCLRTKSTAMSQSPGRIQKKHPPQGFKTTP